MRIDLYSNDSLREGFLARALSDLAAQLIRAFSVHPPRLAPPFGLDLAQALKKQHTARIPGADLCNPARNLVGGIIVHVIDVPPELLIAVLALHRCAGLPLLLGYAFEMPEACLIQAMIGHKDGFEHGFVRPHADDSQVAHIQVHCDRHQVRIELAVLDLFGFDLFDLRKVQF